MTIAMQVTGLAATAFGGLSAGSTTLALKKVTVVAAVFFLVNSVLVAKAVALSRRESTHIIWFRDFLHVAPACFIGAALALLVTRASSMFIWAPLLAAAPLYVTFRIYRIYLAWVEERRHHLKQVSDLHLATVEALARAIDARDQTIDHARPGENHIRRVQAWATSLAEAAGMSPPEVEAVKVAALLHDIGKLAVPEHILSKPGRLTPKEFARVRIHPIVGAEIIKAVPFPYPVAPLIRSHHERWDGSGYPDGLWGAETPMGARVLAVVDYFDALSSTRPYHEAAKRHEAISALIAEAGRALDPALVELFLAILPDLQHAGADAPAAPQPTAPDRSAPIAGFSDETGRSAPSSVFHNISRATQEMRAFHDIAQTLGTRLSVDDTMALLTSKLNRLIPGPCWVLYLHDRVEDVLRCRFATGLPAETIPRLIIPAGEGPSGWAARNRKPVRNGRAAADFEAAGVPASGRPFQSALSYPLVDDEGLIGTLTIYHDERDPFREEHRHVLDHISGQAASVLRNAVAYERMRDVSFTDPLTELPNSRALTDFLRQRVVEAPTGGGPSALIMIDLDDFKAVNDGHGHQKGDAALQAVASAIRDHVRGSDFCARYGGDEFVAVLSGC
ncbi:MAG: HD domain-containing phosphohydrolase, partial [Vicinamibacterales bacterium]